MITMEEQILFTVTVDTPEVIAETVVGAYVLVSKTDNLTPVNSGRTDENGQVEISVPAPGSYLATIEKVGVGFNNDYSVEVPDTGGLGPHYHVDIKGIYIGTTSSFSVERTVVYGYLVRSDGQPLNNSRVVVETVPSSLNTETVCGGNLGVDGNQVLVVPSKFEIRTGATGYWELTLVRGQMVRISIPEAMIDKIFRVPETSPISLKDIVGEVTPGSVGITSDTPATGAFQGNG